MGRNGQKRLSEDDVRVELRLKQLERTGEAIPEERSYFGPLPEIRLTRAVRLDRIIQLTKR
jgi:hypothetical protein